MTIQAGTVIGGWHVSKFPCSPSLYILEMFGSFESSFPNIISGGTESRPMTATFSCVILLLLEPPTPFILESKSGITLLYESVLCVQDHLGNFGSHEFLWWYFSRKEHLAQLRPAEGQSIRLWMWTNLLVGDPHALVAIEEFTEEDRADPKIGELLENLVSGVRPVVVADARVVAPNRDVRAPKVLPHDRVHDRLLWSPVLHLIVKHAQDDRVLRVVVLDKSLVGSHDHVILEIACFLLPEHRVYENPVGEREGGLLHVFMSDVRCVPRLERDDVIPPLFLEENARLLRDQGIVCKFAVLVFGDRP